MIPGRPARPTHPEATGAAFECPIVTVSKVLERLPAPSTGEDALRLVQEGTKPPRHVSFVIEILIATSSVRA
jgi:hypothetical protein